MNSSELDRLGKLIQEGSVPDWVRAYFEEHREEVAQKLKSGESVQLRGPYGQKITIRPTAERNAA